MAAAHWLERVASAREALGSGAPEVDPRVSLAEAREAVERDGPAAAARAIVRLLTLVDVADCLAAEDPGAADQARRFARDVALELESAASSDAALDELSDVILRESGATWGDYIRLIEGDDAPGASAEGISAGPEPDEPAPEEGEGPMDLAALRALLGLPADAEPEAEVPAEPPEVPPASAEGVAEVPAPMPAAGAEPEAMEGPAPAVEPEAGAATEGEAPSPWLGDLRARAGTGEVGGAASILRDQAGALRLQGRAGLALTLDRLASLAELVEALAADEPEISGEGRFELSEALAQVDALFDRPYDDEAAKVIGAPIEERWGEYIRLLQGEDPAPAEPDPFRPAPFAMPEDEPVVGEEADPGTLAGAASLRALLGLGGDAAEVPTEPVPRPEPPAAPRPADFEPAPSAPSFIEAAMAASRLQLDLPGEIREAFVIDAMEQQDRLGQITLALRPGSPDPEALRELRRGLHTLKGAAGSIGLMELANLVHALEDRIEAQGPVPDAQLIATISDTLDYLDRTIDCVRGGDVPPMPDEVLAASVRGGESEVQAPSPLARFEPSPVPPAIEAATTQAMAPAAAGAADGMVHIPAARVDELMDLVAELLTRRGRWGAAASEIGAFGMQARHSRNRMVDLIDRLRSETTRLKNEGLGVRDGGAADEDESAPMFETMRRLWEQAEDVGVLAGNARSVALPLADDGDVLGKVTLQLWDSLQAIRVEPMRKTLQKLARAAMAAARTPGEEKEISVELIGEDTGADKTVQERVSAALMHVVRNAVGHGIEPPDERAKAGKPRDGRVTLAAASEGNTLVVRISDDGKGLDYDAIERKAKQKGLIPGDARPSVEELNKIIFLPGFSTAQRTTGLQGRGVGMDEVAAVISQLQGSIEISSRLGLGTTFTVRLPARFALEQGVVVWIDGQLFALPVASILSTVLFDDSDRTSEGAHPLLHYKGRRASLINAREVLGVSRTPPPPAPKVLILETGPGDVTAVMVDAIEGPRELVVKPLSALIAGHPLITGTGLSTSGEVIFMLDPGALSRRRPELAPRRSEPARGDEGNNAVLVVDDSLSVRRVNARVLRGKGYEVDEASDGMEALQKLRSRTYRLVLSDLEMPRMDGFELLAELGRSGLLDGVPVIVASTKSDAETRRRVMQLGARVFLPKPIGPEAWSEVVDPLLAAAP